MRRLGVLALAALAWSAPAFSATTPGVPAGELVRDNGAESAQGANDSVAQPAVPGWTSTGTFTAVKYGAPEFPDASLGSHIGGGNNFFAGGPGAPQSVGQQDIDVSSGAARIDQGGVPVTLSGFLGGFSSQGDNVVVSADFIANGRAIGTMHIGPVTAADRADQTTLLLRSASSTVPAGTRTIRVFIIAQRTDGSYNDGYADNISLRLEPTPPPPAFAKTVTATPVSGSVLVELPRSKKFVSISDVRSLPVGSIIDARRGRVRLTASDGHGGTQFSDFYQGEFKLLQPKGGKGLVQLNLFGGSFKSCPAGLRFAKKAKSVRHLWGEGSGKFRTQGRFASATIRGTTWLTTDRCDGTQVKVTVGSVAVRDLVKRKNAVVSAPGQYFAAGKKR